MVIKRIDGYQIPIFRNLLTESCEFTATAGTTIILIITIISGDTS